MSRYRALFFIAVVVGVALLSGFKPLYFGLYSLAIAVAIGSLWARIQTSGLRAEITAKSLFPKQGEPLEVNVSLIDGRNMTRWGLGVAVADRHTEGQAVLALTKVVDVPQRGAVWWTAELGPRRRGMNQVGPVVIEGSDPLGFRKHRRYIGSSKSILVYPRTIPFPTASLTSTGEGSRGADPALQTYGVSTTARLREYAPRDPLSHIHWPTTARLDRLMTMEFEDDSSSRAAHVVLDLEQVVHTGFADESTEEYAVTIAASLAVACLDADVPVGLLAIGESTINLAPDAGKPQREKILEALALATARGRTPVARLLLEHRSQMEPGGRIYVITPSVTSALTRLLEGLEHSGVGVIVLPLYGPSFDQWRVDSPPDGADHLPMHGSIRKGDDLSLSIPAILDRSIARQKSAY